MMIVYNPASSIFWGCVSTWALLALGAFIGREDPAATILGTLGATAITVGTLLVTRQRLAMVLRPGGVAWRVVVYLLIIVSVLHHMVAHGGPTYAMFLTAMFLGMCVGVLRNVWRVVSDVDQGLGGGWNDDSLVVDDVDSHIDVGRGVDHPRSAEPRAVPPMLTYRPLADVGATDRRSGVIDSLRRVLSARVERDAWLYALDGGDAVSAAGDHSALAGRSGVVVMISTTIVALALGITAGLTIFYLCRGLMS